jgi:predicted O-methyltransferase YrrM
MSPRRLLKSLYGTLHRAVVNGVNKMGWVVARTSDYYSPLRPLSELKRNVERWHRPSAMTGVAFDLPAMMAELKSMAADYLSEYDKLPTYDEIRAQRRGPGVTRVDARVLYMMLRRHRPARYIEVGSGLSTWYAAQAGAKNAAVDRPMAMTVVDPFVSEATRTLPDIEVLDQEAQDLPVEWFTSLAAGDVLFIDSTHIVRIDGEVPYLVLEVLPALDAGVLIHVHDVNFPYNVPYDPDAYVFDRRRPMLFTESMLVQAYLCNNPAVEILMSTPLLRHFHEESLRRALPDYQAFDPEDFDTHHSSLWLRRLEGPAAVQRIG